MQQVFFHGYVLVKGNLRSNEREASLTESLVCNSISQLSIDGVFICCVQSLEALNNQRVTNGLSLAQCAYHRS